MTKFRTQSNVFTVENDKAFYVVVTEHYSGEDPPFVTEALSIQISDDEKDGEEIFVTSSEMRQIGLMIMEFGTIHECAKVRT